MVPPFKAACRITSLTHHCLSLSILFLLPPLLSHSSTSLTFTPSFAASFAYYMSYLHALFRLGQPEMYKPTQFGKES